MRPILLTLALVACNGPDEAVDEPSPLLDVTEIEARTMPGLSAEGYVIYTEGGIPHVYAENRVDLARLQAFTLSRDRFFSIDLVRRLSTGRLSELMGDATLDADAEARAAGMTFATDALLAAMNDEERAIWQGFADGINDYIAAVRAGTLPGPSEYDLLGPLLSSGDPLALMAEFTLRDVAAIGGSILYRLGFETDDIGRTADVARMEGLFDGAPLETLRTDAAWEALADKRPIHDVPSAPGFGRAPTSAAPVAPPVQLPAMPIDVLDRATIRGDWLDELFGRDEYGYGSNAWAVAGSKSADGRALLAGDGHLELDIPALMYQIGLDTEHLGSGEIHQMGALLVGTPMLAIGTNGDVAWSTTQHSGDITDWYSECLALDATGEPVTSLFRGNQEALITIDESVEVAGVLGSTERTESWKRWTTFDGRWIWSIEGHNPSSVAPGAGQTVVRMGGDTIIPADVDGDGCVYAVSFDFTGLDKGHLFRLLDTLGTVSTVEEIREAGPLGLALSQNLVAADSSGDVLYTGYQGVPCRDYLRAGDGSWLPGGDPTMLLDGTTFGGFTIPMEDSRIVEEGPEDPYRCVIPMEEYPYVITPEQGYVLSANQDPGGIASDGDIFNDAIYMGGPWTEGYRADTIDRHLAEMTARGATVDDMSELQGNHESPMAWRHMDDLLADLDAAEALAEGTPATDAEDRIAQLWTDNAERFGDVRDRLAAWQIAGMKAESGVETFYHEGVDQAERDAAVATMIFNVWIADLIGLAIDDEGLPGAVFHGGGTAGRMRMLDRMYLSRGDGNPSGTAGYNPETAEHVFWDAKGTPDEVETSVEIAMMGLASALDFLESDPSDDAEGGFGTTDMDAWLWGLRHQVEFESLLAAYLDDPFLAGLFTDFSVTTDTLPLAPGLSRDDPRSELTWFPRPGDNRNIDAANPGLSGRRFRHGSGPVMRMVFALGPDGVEGRNIVPGGQSGVLGSENFADQAALWLGNETLPVHFTVDEVVANATGRVTFSP